jgi:hypothetical protein
MAADDLLTAVLAALAPLAAEGNDVAKRAANLARGIHANPRR